MQLQIELQDHDTILNLSEYAKNMPIVLYQGMLKAVQYLRSKVDENISSGKFGIKTDSGSLRRSLAADVDVDGNDIVGIVGSNLPYAGIQEYGGQTAPHIIEARKAKALRFMGKGGWIFVKRVNHPGSKIPAHWYMRNTLIEEKQAILNILEQAMKQ